MKVDNQHYHTIWHEKSQNQSVIKIIDQRQLPHQFSVESLTTLNDVIQAVSDMHVRGAPLIGVTAAFGLHLAAQCFDSHITENMAESAQKLKNARPTAINLAWAVDFVLNYCKRAKTQTDWFNLTLEAAELLKKREIEHCQTIGQHGVHIIQKIYEKKQAPVNILTHCNAGWLACIDYGTATAPIYEAQARDIPVHVWVDETRPRNQGASLTAWELAQQGVSHTVIVDNVGGHLMQHGKVDMVIVGSDRTTRCGDVANKIGTYLKALAAKDNNVPFYVALPSSTIDWTICNGIKEIPIEKRNGDEVRFVIGLQADEIKSVLITPKESSVCNYAFDVTPAHLVSGLITERGVCAANERDILRLFPEHK